jgi:DNA-binding NtrC family response regulator
MADGLREDAGKGHTARRVVAQAFRPANSAPVEEFHVDCAPTAESGLTIARTRVHDAIVLDERLPDRSGLNTLEQLRAEAILIPVLFLTAYPDLELAVSSIRLGAWDFKPKTILLGDDWVAVFRGLARAGRSMKARALLHEAGCILRTGWHRLPSAGTGIARSRPGHPGDGSRAPSGRYSDASL